jgi:hypothetical protein
LRRWLNCHQPVHNLVNGSRISWCTGTPSRSLCHWERRSPRPKLS